MDGWLDAGQCQDEFWSRSLREIDLVFRAHLRRVKRAARIRRVQAYEVAQLIGLAVNQPKDFPKPAAYLDDAPRKPASEIELRAYLMARVRSSKRA